jgi:hypothetical protein
LLVEVGLVVIGLIIVARITSRLNYWSMGEFFFSKQDKPVLNNPDKTKRDGKYLSVIVLVLATIIVIHLSPGS